METIASGQTNISTLILFCLIILTGSSFLLAAVGTGSLPFPMLAHAD